MLRAEVLMKASVIHERLAAVYGFTGNYQRVKLYVQEARPRIAEELGITPKELASVTDLHRVRQSPADRFGIGGRAVPAYDLDPGMFTQPGLQRGGLAVGQHRDAPAGLGIRDDRGVAVAAAQGEIVHADHPRDRLPRQRQAPQTTQRGAA